MWQFVSEWKLIYTDMRFSTISSRWVTCYTFIMILVQAFYDGLMISIPTQLMTVLQSPFMTKRGERRKKKIYPPPTAWIFIESHSHLQHSHSPNKFLGTNTMHARPLVVAALIS